MNLPALRATTSHKSRFVDFQGLAKHFRGNSDGYPLELSPGIAGTLGFLTRGETAVVKPTISELRFEWICTKCPICVVNTAGEETTESRFVLNGASYQNGESLQLPVTDNATYPSISGAWANGYPIWIKPADTAGSETFAFEVLPGGAFVPEWFTIDGKEYGLRFACNQPPVVDAGDNVSILSQEQNSAIITGQASDPDGDTLTYRWLEGEADLLIWADVESDDSCPLLLGLAPLSLGEHTLTLEVSDGTMTVSDTMVLTVGNSPPTVACAGSINASVWSPVELNATVADFDGDTLSWTWSLGTETLAEGEAWPPPGGTPVALPPVLLPDGLDIGSYTFTLTVSDRMNPEQSCNLAVTVTDTDALTLAPVANPAILWPPNHKMVDVLIETHAADNSGGAVTVTVGEITSTEDPDKDGDGHTIPDYQLIGIDQATGVIHLQLRSERSGKGPGRTYTITITATDSSENATTVDLQVQAPHDKGK